ncbi:MAG TPA: PEGA domain-containing protein [Polyangia bacterium]|nr:PEGA domain-containing protein [Polyangia bacterium]
MTRRKNASDIARASLTRASLIGGVLGALLLAGCPRPQPAPKGESEVAPPAAGNLPQPSPPPAAGNPPASGNLPQPGALPPPPPAPPPKPPGKIKIIVRSIPTKANVRWGKKVLGQTPFTLERPRDSGPVDLIVVSDGYFPVHTRAYTFRNDAFTVKLTKLDDRMTLFGAKKELESLPINAPPDSLAAPPADSTPPPGLAPLEPAPVQPAPSQPAP